MATGAKADPTRGWEVRCCGNVLAAQARGDHPDRGWAKCPTCGQEIAVDLYMSPLVQPRPPRGTWRGDSA